MGATELPERRLLKLTCWHQIMGGNIDYVDAGASEVLGEENWGLLSLGGPG